MFDGEAFGKDMVDIVRGHVERATSPLLARIDALEKRELLLPEKGDPGEKGDAGEVDMDAIKALIDEAVAGIEIPESVAGEKGDPGEKGDAGHDGSPGEKGDPGKDGMDGAGLADALIDKDGSLILTMTDGRTKNLGPANGKDGKDGTNGRDGLNADDVEVKIMDDGRTMLFSVVGGDIKHSFELTFPFVLDRGVWQSDHDYERGDAVSWGGSLWIAQKDTTDKPGGEDWRLAVKKGRDGKDAK